MLIEEYVNSKTTLDTIYELSKQYLCTIIELTNNKTIYCFGKILLKTYKETIVVDLNNIDNFRFITYYPKLKINSKQIIYKYKYIAGNYYKNTRMWIK